MNFTEEDIKKLDRFFRLNLINGVTGIKPANLIGTISSVGEKNLARAHPSQFSLFFYSNTYLKLRRKPTVLERMKLTPFNN
jgi:hypothetical protein